MKIELEKIRLGVTGISQEIVAGIPESDNKSMKHHTNVTSDFIKCIIDWCGGFKRTIKGSDGRKWEITVKEITNKASGSKLAAKS